MQIQNFGEHNCFIKIYATLVYAVYANVFFISTAVKIRWLTTTIEFVVRVHKWKKGIDFN